MWLATTTTGLQHARLGLTDAQMADQDLRVRAGRHNAALARGKATLGAGTLVHSGVVGGFMDSGGAELLAEYAHDSQALRVVAEAWHDRSVMGGIPLPINRILDRFWLRGDGPDSVKRAPMWYTRGVTAAPSADAGAEVMAACESSARMSRGAAAFCAALKGLMPLTSLDWRDLLVTSRCTPAQRSARLAALAQSEAAYSEAADASLSAVHDAAAASPAVGAGGQVPLPTAPPSSAIPEGCNPREDVATAMERLAEEAGEPTAFLQPVSFIGTTAGGEVATVSLMVRSNPGSFPNGFFFGRKLLFN